MPFTIITESTSLKPTFLYKVLDDSINGFNDDGEKYWKFMEFIKLFPLEEFLKKFSCLIRRRCSEVNLNFSKIEAFVVGWEIQEIQQIEPWKWNFIFSTSLNRLWEATTQHESRNRQLMVTLKWNLITHLSFLCFFDFFFLSFLRSGLDDLRESFVINLPLNSNQSEALTHLGCVSSSSSYPLCPSRRPRRESPTCPATAFAPTRTSCD